MLGLWVLDDILSLCRSNFEIWQNSPSPKTSQFGKYSHLTLCRARVLCQLCRWGWVLGSFAQMDQPYRCLTYWPRAAYYCVWRTIAGFFDDLMIDFFLDDGLMDGFSFGKVVVIWFSFRKGWDLMSKLGGRRWSKLRNELGGWYIWGLDVITRYYMLLPQELTWPCWDLQHNLSKQHLHYGTWKCYALSEALQFHCFSICLKPTQPWLA